MANKTEIIEKMRTEIEDIKIHGWKEEYKLVEFKDFKIRVLYSEDELGDCHPNYEMSLHFDKCEYFEKLSIYDSSDCYMCNKEARDELNKSIMEKFEKEVNRFYNEEDEINLRIKNHKKEIRKIKDKIKKLEFYKNCDALVSGGDE